MESTHTRMESNRARRKSPARIEFRWTDWPVWMPFDEPDGHDLPAEAKIALLKIRWRVYRVEHAVPFDCEFRIAQGDA